MYYIYIYTFIYAKGNIGSEKVEIMRFVPTAWWGCRVERMEMGKGNRGWR